MRKLCISGRNILRNLQKLFFGGSYEARQGRVQG